MNKEAIERLIEKNPRLKESQAKLESLKPGAYCMHGSWGFGYIKSYDSATDRLIIDFETQKDHAMAPAFCADKLEVLPDSNILVRSKKEADLIAELIKKKPVDLIIEILKNYPNTSASSVELENLLGALLGEKSRKWWNATKKLLEKDPRVATPSKKSAPYVLRDEPVKPEQEILEEFYITKQPLRKIHLAEKLHSISTSVKEIEKDLKNIFEEMTVAIKDARGLTQADRLYGVWVRNNLARHLHENVDELEPTSASIIRATENLSELALQLPSNYQRRYLDVITRVYPDTWKDVVVDLLRNSTGKFTHECVVFLYDHEQEALLSECFTRWLNEQSLKSSVLIWILKNRGAKKFTKVLKPLVGPRLLGATLYAIDYEALQSTTSRRIPLAELLSDDKEIISDLLEASSNETARDLAQTLLLNQGFEDLSKKSILARFISLFPDIQTLITTQSDRQAEQLIVSQESLNARKKEYEDLVHVKIPANKEAIAIAREHGDLKENSEYKMARQDQETLLARKALLENELARAHVTDFSDASVDTVGIGSTVELVDSKGKVYRYSFLGAWDSAPEKNILSYKTPLGQSLLGKKVGEHVRTQIEGNSEDWSIRNISRWIDSK